MAFLLALLLTVSPAFGSDTRMVSSNLGLDFDETVAQVELISASRTVPPSGELLMGLRVKLAPRWKTYWRSPGDAGLAPRLIVSPQDISTGISASDNSAVPFVEMLWPLPERFNLFGIDTVGYSGDATGEVIFPLKVQVQQPDLGLKWSPRLDLLLCSNICIPQTFLLSAHLGATQATVKESQYATLLNAALETVPETASPTQPLQITGFHLEREAQKPYIVTTLKRTDHPFQKPDLFIEIIDKNGLLVPVGRPEIELFDKGFTAQLRTPLLLNWEEMDIGEETLATLTARDGTSRDTIGLELTAPVFGLPIDIQAPANELNFFLYLVIALAGGLILNVMPCVLPVLSLKLLSFVDDAHANIRKSNSKGLFATALGMVLAFLGLAFILVLIRSGGGLIGWGVQFQSPTFLVVMSVICILMAMNLLGFFTFRLPALPMSWQRNSSNTGHSISNGFLDNRFWGHVGTGCVAALLSTPCSAPFVGVAAGFALTQSSTAIVAVFFAMGIGFALPFLLAGAWPRALRILPRPGPWMITFRRIMAIPLLLLAVWLTAIALDQIRGTQGRDAQRLMLKGWAAFEPQAISTLVENGQVVLITLTADWCVTCKINKIRVYDNEEIKTLLDDEQIIRQVGDWTRSDPEITAFLASHHRAGIPFDIIYGPKNPEGLILPEILAPRDIKAAISAVRD